MLRTALRRYHHRGGAPMGRVDIPKTPNNQDPYTVFGLNPMSATSESIAKQHKKLVVENHPDRPGGSNDKMSEINAAYTILKDNHERIQEQMKAQSASARQHAESTAEFYQQAQASREEILKRTGGIRDANAKSWKVNPNIEAEWTKYKAETDRTVKRMTLRFELACEQGLYMRKVGNLQELVARERWLVKGFVKGMWEDIHVMKQENQKARSRQQRELAEDMVGYGNSIESKLMGNFKRVATLTTHKGLAMSFRWAARGLVSVMVMYGVFYNLVIKTWWRNTYAVRFKGDLIGNY